MNKKIYGIDSCAHLGDIWSTISSAILYSKKNKEKVYLSRYADHKTHDRKDILLECLNALDTTEANIEIVDDLQNQYDESTTYFPISKGAFLNENPIVSTKIKHNPKDQNTISVQLASLMYDKNKNIYTSRKYSAQNEYKNIPYLELEKIFINFISFNNIKICSVGEHAGGLANSIKILSESRIFIGIDSGMAHLALSVGVPVYLYDFKQNEDIYLHQFYKNKDIKTFKTFDDILKIFHQHNIIYNISPTAEPVDFNMHENAWPPKKTKKTKSE